jgi:hypothetical protein
MHSVLVSQRISHINKDDAEYEQFFAAVAVICFTLTCHGYTGALNELRMVQRHHLVNIRAMQLSAFDFLYQVSHCTVFPRCA